MWSTQNFWLPLQMPALSGPQAIAHLVKRDRTFESIIFQVENKPRALLQSLAICMMRSLCDRPKACFRSRRKTIVVQWLRIPDTTNNLVDQFFPQFQTPPPN